MTDTASLDQASQPLQLRNFYLARQPLLDRNQALFGYELLFRNRADGSVEALFAGHGPDVDAMLDACWQGPPNAIVIYVKVAEATDPGLSGFDQRPSV